MCIDANDWSLITHLHAQVLVANYEDRLTTMEAPDDNDEDSEAHR